MRKLIIIATTLIAFALAACAEGALPPREDVEVRTRGLTEPEQITLEALSALGTQVSLGQPITVDANLLSGIIGAPPLSGQLVLDFLWTERGPVVEDRIRPLVVGATFKPIEAHEGEFLVVHYTVENKSDGILQPLRRINDNLSLIDSQGRKYVPAGFQFHGFAAGAAFALQTGGDDTRDMLGPGSKSTTAVAFDIPLDASGFRLRSEAGNFEVALVGGAGRPAIATPTAVPTVTPTVAPVAAEPTAIAVVVAQALPEGQDPTEYLTALMKEYFGGETNRLHQASGLIITRLHILTVGPARTGDGLKVVVEYSADDIGSTEGRKAAVDKQLWDAFSLLFSSPAAANIATALINVRDGIETHSGLGVTAVVNAVVYRAYVTRETAATMDWSRSPSNLSDAWDTVTLHPRYD